MKINNPLLIALIVTAISITSCKKSKVTDPVVNGEEVLTGNITANKTLNAGTKYTLKGYVYVKNGATLTIPAGTVIIGDKGNATSDPGTLIITMGAKIDARGTATNPIVFTSSKPVGQRAPGDWGGIILLGKAKVNTAGGTDYIEGVPVNEDTKFGGTNDDDNSGAMQYVRIEYPGIALSPNNEINGLTFGGVGRGTTIDHIQVSFSGDDAFEWFGGTVNCKYLIAQGSIDDDFDMDKGFSGKLQFLVAQRDPRFADQSGSNGIECDNDPSSTGNALLIPNTRPVISNMTLIGPNNATGQNPQFKNGNQWRRGTKFVLRNSIIVGFPNSGIYIDGELTALSVANGTAEFSNNLVHSNTSAATFLAGNGATSYTTATLTAYAGTKANVTLATAADAKLTDPFNTTTPNFLPATGSPALSAVNFAGTDLSNAFFSAVTYKGAFGTTDWTSGWAIWNSQNKAY